MRPYRSATRCPKCDDDDITVRWEQESATHPGWNKQAEEWLCLRCMHCGYEWQAACLDGEVNE